MKKIAIGCLMVFIISIAWCNVAAQVSEHRMDKHPSDTGYALGEIVVEWTRLQIPFSRQNRNITIIDRKTINALPAKSVNEILQYVAGVDIRQRGPAGVQADVGIDGGTFDQTLVLLNGIKVTDPQTGHNMMNLPVGDLAIDRIEILKGAAARIFGINALTGAINIITRQPGTTGATAMARAGSSFIKDTSNGKLFAGYDLGITTSIASDHVKNFIAASQAHSSGYRYNTAFSNQKVFYQNQIAAGKNSVSLTTGYVNNKFGANGFYAAPNDKESQEQIQTFIAAASATLKMSSQWVFRPRFSYRHNKDDYIFKKQNPEFYRNIHQTNAWDLELNNTVQTGSGAVGWGIELRSESINSNSLGIDDRQNLGIFAEYSFSKIDRLLVNAGAYVNYNSAFGWEVLPGIDAGFDLNGPFRVFVNAGTGQRLPTFTDLYYKGPANIGNAALRPEHSFHTETGVKFNSGDINASLSYFHKTVYDFIDWVKEEVTDPWQPQNFKNINTDGISFSSDYRLVDEHHVKGLSIISGLSYTWLSPRISSKSEKISQYALSNLRHQLTVYEILTLQKKYHFTITGKYQQRIHYKDYFLLDARAGIDFGKWNAFVDGNNILNVAYVEAGAVPMPPRWMTIGIKLEM